MDGREVFVSHTQSWLLRDNFPTMQNFAEPAPSVKKISVCVVGAGAAGLSMARHLSADPLKFEFDVYEQGYSLGGTWVYTDEIGRDVCGLPILSSMYSNLRTNILQEIMGFPDFPFPDAIDNSYPKHEVVLEYLQKYAEYFSLEKHIQFNHEVKIILPMEEKGGQKWSVTVVDHNTNETKTRYYDAVAVCNGHYSKPLIPDICDVELFRGNVLHSHEYRFPEPFTNTAVAVLGAGASGRDLAIDIAPFASVVYLCHSQAKLASRLPANVLQKPSIVSATEDSFVLEDNSHVQVDSLILCTGYRYHFPFLHSACGVRTLGRRVRPLYKHMLHIQRPTLAFIGIPFIVVPFPMFHFQSLYFIRSLLDPSLLPCKYDMYEEEEKDFQSRLNSGLPPRHAHKMGDLQWEYNNCLAELAGVPRLHPAYEEFYNINSYQQKNCLMEYKKKNYAKIFREKLNE